MIELLFLAASALFYKTARIIHNYKSWKLEYGNTSFYWRFYIPPTTGKNKINKHKFWNMHPTKVSFKCWTFKTSHYWEVSLDQIWLFKHASGSHIVQSSWSWRCLEKSIWKLACLRTKRATTFIKIRECWTALQLHTDPHFLLHLSRSEKINCVTDLVN